jgi:hypothetical protein
MAEAMVEVVEDFGMKIAVTDVTWILITGIAENSEGAHHPSVEIEVEIGTG